MEEKQNEPLTFEDMEPIDIFGMVALHAILSNPDVWQAQNLDGLTKTAWNAASAMVRNRP